MLDLARDTFGSKLRVVERWQGVYGAKCHVPGSGAVSVTRVDDRTTVALMHSGIGMSVGPALAHRLHQLVAQRHPGRGGRWHRHPPAAPTRGHACSPQPGW
ncbi:hypothetical protein G6F68_021252 [Rhizopus microsporus]|nr:hypothetical protein G6F68_021252 [Rhizopus microsporus]